MDPELGLESRAAKCFHGGKTDGVHLGRDRNDLIGAEVSAEKRLLRVAERRVDKTDASFLLRHYAVARAARFSL